jgi:hypothetical protein
MNPFENSLAAHANQVFVEASDDGKVYDAVLIRAGASQNGIYYPDAVLREAALLFEGVRVFAKPDAEHICGDGKDVRNIVGWVSGAHFVEGKAVDAGHVAGRVNFAADTTGLRATISDAWKRGKRDLVGLSIDALGRAKAAGQSLREGIKKIATAITKINSVDLVVDPSAGGILVRFVEAVANESGKVVMPDFGRVEVEDRYKRIGTMLDAFFDPKHPGHNKMQSFREAYIEITGDQQVTGRMDRCDHSRMAESLGVFREALDSTSFPNALGASITRMMVRDYNRPDHWNVWRKLVTIANRLDFRSQIRVRIGGYGDLPMVAENDPYLALVSPPEDTATYAVGKRGGTENISLEMIKNDDVGVIRRIPKRLAEAAKRTIAHFVLDLLRLNPVIYDGVALFHAAHNNLGAAALSAVSLAAGRAAMMKQTELGSGEQTGTEPAYLWVPIDLEETAKNLFRRANNQDKTFVQNMQVEVVPVWYWTDVNDWCLSADPERLPSVEMGFIDGQQDPELFIQDIPLGGSMFTNDQITYKIRHRYGGAVIDYRGLYKSVN